MNFSTSAAVSSILPSSTNTMSLLGERSAMKSRNSGAYTGKRSDSLNSGTTRVRSATGTSGAGHESVGALDAPGIPAREDDRDEASMVDDIREPTPPFDCRFTRP